MFVVVVAEALIRSAGIHSLRVHLWDVLRGPSQAGLFSNAVTELSHLHLNSLNALRTYVSGRTRPPPWSLSNHPEGRS